MSTSIPVLGCPCPARELHGVIGLLESWLPQASDEVLDELAEFAFGPDPGPYQRRVEKLIELIGLTAARLRPASGHRDPRELR